MDAQDQLLTAKVNQVASRTPRRNEQTYKIGDRVMLSTEHRRREYRAKGEKRVATFMPRFDGPYTILEAWPEKSTYTLDLPNSSNIFPTFHVCEIRPYQNNDDVAFPSRKLERPGPVVTDEGQEEWLVERIIDERRRGRGRQFLVRWKGYRPGNDTWLPEREMDKCVALDEWMKKKADGSTEDDDEDVPR